MQLSEKAKRFWAFAVSFVYPAMVLVVTDTYRAQITELGFSKTQCRLLVAFLLTVPVLILIYQNIRLALSNRKQTAGDSSEPIIRWTDECLSLVLLLLLLALPGILFGLVDNQVQGIYEPLFNLPSLIVVAC